MYVYVIKLIGCLSVFENLCLNENNNIKNRFLIEFVVCY